MTLESGSRYYYSWVLALLGLLNAPVRADEKDSSDLGPWEFSGTVEGIEIKTRPVQGSRVRQVLGQVVTEGTVAEFQRVLTDVENFPKFMPYVKEGRVLQRESPTIVQTYLRLQLPWPVANRDYATRRVTDVEPDASGNGDFRVHWSAIPDAVPPTKNTVRVARNDGFWLVTTRENGMVLLQHGFIVDPGGSLPIVTVNYGNKKGVPDLFHAVIGEVRRRRAEAEAKPPVGP